MKFSFTFHSSKCVTGLILILLSYYGGNIRMMSHDIFELGGLIVWLVGFCLLITSLDFTLIWEGEKK